MKTHPYLRAYMAGITIPTIMLIVIMVVFTLSRFVFDVPLPFERIVVFPMAIVPNLWGLWNVLYLFLRRYPYMKIGYHGAILGIVQMLIAFGVAGLIGFEFPGLNVAVLPVGVPVVMIVFYLVWKHFVAFLNGVLGLE
jgi:hypothetical protein